MKSERVEKLIKQVDEGFSLTHLEGQSLAFYIRTLEKEKADMKTDFWNVVGNYWYTLRGWLGKCELLEVEYKQHEKCCKDIMSKYNFF